MTKVRPYQSQFCTPKDSKMFDDVYNKRLKEMAKITPDNAKDSPFYRADTSTNLEYKILPLVSIGFSCVYLYVFAINFGAIQFVGDLLFGSQK